MSCNRSSGLSPAASFLRARAVLCCSAFLCCLYAGGVGGAPIYAATASGCIGVSGGPEPGAQFVATGQGDCTGASAWGSASARSDAHGVGGDLLLTTLDAGNPGFWANSYVYTQYMITGPSPAGTVEISLNLQLTGGLGGGIPGGKLGGNSYRRITADANMTHLFSRTIIWENANTVTGFTASDQSLILCSPCNFQTATFTVPVNTWIPMRLEVNLLLEAQGTTHGTASYLNTFYFPVG